MSGLVFVIDKSAGPSSFDMVREMKRVFPGEKIGHAGSLDPFATGVLVLLLGKATKLSGGLLNADKRYVAKVKLGEATDSMDRTGIVTETMPVPELTEATVTAVLDSFQGEWLQTPPMFSAKKVNGVRLYELARKNMSIEREQVPVDLYELKLVKLELPYLEFEVHCSKGTYVRSLADELARKLGTVGHLSELRRVSCGGFGIEESVTVKTIGASRESFLPQGYRNYVRLLSEEKVMSRRPPPRPVSRPMNRMGTAQFANGGKEC